MNTVKRLNDFGLAQRVEDYIKARRDDPADSRLPGIALVDPACDPLFHLVRKELIGRSDGATIFDDFALLELTREFMLRTLTTTTGLDILCEILVELQVRRSEEIAVRRERAKNFQPGQLCSNCNLFKGKTGDAWGPCDIFSGREVTVEGWCSAWVKKP